MQTFLPYPDFEASARVLDYRRLGKQRVEAKQILNALQGLSKGWVNHPATVMWRGHEEALKLYMNTCITEWVTRGYKNTMPILPTGLIVYPKWFGGPEFHLSHQSNLLRKAPEYYSKYFNGVPSDLQYVWPTP